jgi:hypothetical protein
VLERFDGGDQSMTKAMTLAFWHPNAPAIFTVAVNSAKRMNATRRQGGHDEPLVSVVFAAAAVEAFLNEAGYLAGGRNSLQAAEPPAVQAFSQVMEEAEESRASVLSKFNLASLVLTGTACARGKPPYQDFADLVAVRNLMMHGKSKERFSRIDEKPVLINPTAVLDRLASKHLLHEAPPEHLNGFVAMVGESSLAEVIYADEMEGISAKESGSRMMTRWIYLVGTRAVAEWACNAASRMVLDTIEKAPEGRWKQMLNGQFRKTFEVPFEDEP